MSKTAKLAIEMYQQAVQAEQKGRTTLADSYYLQSQAMFKSACETSRTYCLNAANTLNALTFLRWSGKDYEGALQSAKESVKIMETYSPQFSGPEAGFIYDTSRELLDQIQYELALVSTK